MLLVDKILTDLPEKVETPRLILQMPRAGYGAKLYDAIMDGYDEFMKWLNWEEDREVEPPTALSMEEECRRHHAAFILRDYIRYLVIDKSNNTVLGWVSYPLKQANWSVPQFEIDYFTRKSSRGKGYATEATHAMTILAFDVLEARKIEIYCDTENIASCKVPEKLNFQWEYTQLGGWPRQDEKLAILRTYSMFEKIQLPPLEVKW